MKTAVFSLAFAFMGTAFSQEISRCGCADANDWLISGVEALVCLQRRRGSASESPVHQGAVKVHGRRVHRGSGGSQG
ncbi:hypothetical protein CSHISOI_10703 [Colletotrichum shisoi]|uniref:Uncharacterized protein n=1 Tax=Colletotrichum shisoi TaxID=2078593 RepID=A0A5Q4BCU0_9PEZI|nr:hypothetical protein CSHISOI_10703 [Colletotrichum shisoi]